MVLKSTNVFNDSSIDKELINVLLKRPVDFEYYGIILLEEDYDKYFGSNLDNIIDLVERHKSRLGHLMNDYICVLKSGTLNFYHYSPLANLESLKASVMTESSSLSFCGGIYCYLKDTHNPRQGTNFVYQGVYTGPYLECIYDCDPYTEFENKAEGHTKEFVMLTDEVKCSLFVFKQ